MKCRDRIGSCSALHFSQLDGNSQAFAQRGAGCIQHAARQEQSQLVLESGSEWHHRAELGQAGLRRLHSVRSALEARDDLEQGCWVKADHFVQGLRREYISRHRHSRRPLRQAASQAGSTPTSPDHDRHSYLNKAASSQLFTGSDTVWQDGNGRASEEAIRRSSPARREQCIQAVSDSAYLAKLGDRHVEAQLTNPKPLAYAAQHRTESNSTEVLSQPRATLQPQLEAKSVQSNASVHQDSLDLPCSTQTAPQVRTRSHPHWLKDRWNFPCRYRLNRRTIWVVKQASLQQHR
ncbi:hypothetical protein WJX79_006312 [Trebouxia sp. C0005]